jgi:hypothetical protein
LRPITSVDPLVVAVMECISDREPTTRELVNPPNVVVEPGVGVVAVGSKVTVATSPVVSVVPAASVCRSIPMVSDAVPPGLQDFSTMLCLFVPDPD